MLNPIKIKKIEKIETENYKPVFDLEIKDNHNYFAENHLVHNCHQVSLEGLFGPISIITTTKKLMDEGFISKFEIKCLVLKYPEYVSYENKNNTYDQEKDFILENSIRNKFIRNLTLSLKNNTIVLFRYVDKHGKILYDMIKDKNDDPTRKIFFVHGGVDVQDREMIRNIVTKEKNAIIVASQGTMSTGTNIPNLHNMIFASPSKSRIKVIQSIGRVLRLAENKEYATIFDIADDLRIGSYVNNTLNHYMERLKIYNEEEFYYRIYNIGVN